MTQKEETVYRILADEVRRRLQLCRLEPEKLQEIRLRIGKPVFIRYDGTEYALSENGSLTDQPSAGYCVTEADLRETLSYLSGYSLYAFDEELRQGFFTIAGGHRVGITGKTVLEHGCVSGMRYISFINIRFAHQVKGCGDEILPHLIKDGAFLNTLIVSPPGAGKTTMLRDLIRQISDGTRYLRGKTVGVVDERSEIAGCWQGVPQNDVGMRTDVLDCCRKAEGMMMLLRSMSPSVIAVDEIGSCEDEAALERVFSCGCKLLVSAHGSSLADLQKKKVFQTLMDAHMFERFVLLQDVPGKRVRTVLDEDGTLLYRTEKEAVTEERRMQGEKNGLCTGEESSA